MTYTHKSLASGRWLKMSFLKQMANIGSEVERCANAKESGSSRFDMALQRALELIDLTISDPKNTNRLKELCRLREVFADYCLDNSYFSTAENWRSYFYPFIRTQSQAKA